MVSDGLDKMREVLTRCKTIYQPFKDPLVSKLAVESYLHDSCLHQFWNGSMRMGCGLHNLHCSNLCIFTQTISFDTLNKFPPRLSFVYMLIELSKIFPWSFSWNLVTCFLSYSPSCQNTLCAGQNLCCGILIPWINTVKLRILQIGCFKCFQRPVLKIKVWLWVLQKNHNARKKKLKDWK